MVTKQHKNLLLFLCITFLLPLISVCLQSLTNYAGVKFILFGIQAAAPSIAAVVLIVKEQRIVSFCAENFNVHKMMTSFVFPLALAFFTMLFAKMLACFLLQEPFTLRNLPASQTIIILWAFVAEELGWRGYLQPFLCKHMKRAYLAPLVVGIVWGVWHYHYFLFGALQVPLGWFFAGCIAESYLYIYLVRQSGNNLFSAMTYHFAWNLCLHIFALNPIDNNGNTLRYRLIIVIEICILLLFFLFHATHRKANKLRPPQTTAHT